MTRLVLNGKAQSVTSMLSYEDSKGNLYIVLARPDPRYRDRTGKCLNGALLPVGGCQFVGGMVEEHAAAGSQDSPGMIALGAVSGLPTGVNPKVFSSALREMSEEMHFDLVKFVTPETSLRAMAIVTRDDPYAGQQDINYFNLHLGRLSDAAIVDLRSEVHPGDDLIQTIHIRARDLEMDAKGAVIVTPAKGLIKTKTNFSGFPELEDWNKKYDAAITKAAKADDDALLQKIRSERDAYNRMHVEIRDLQGIDPASLEGKTPVGMFDPRMPGVRSDGQILEDYLTAFFPGQVPATVPKTPTAQFSRAVQGIEETPVLVLATRNENKVNELREMLAGTSREVIGLDQLERRLGLAAHSLGDVPEPETTYEGNACLKATAIADAIRASGTKAWYSVVADDSGLELDDVVWKKGDDLAAGESRTMAGLPFPGVGTKPFVEAVGGSPEAFKFYDSVIGVGRSLSAVTALAVIDTHAAPGVAPRFFHGAVKGTMVMPPRGMNGFDYDLVFQPDGHSRTFAEMSLQEKSAVSHRRRAFEAMLGSTEPAAAPKAPTP